MSYDKSERSRPQQGMALQNIMEDFCAVRISHSAFWEKSSENSQSSTKRPQSYRLRRLPTPPEICTSAVDLKTVVVSAGSAPLRSRGPPRDPPRRSTLTGRWRRSRSQYGRENFCGYGSQQPFLVVGD